MTRHTLRSSLWLLIILLGAVARPGSAQAPATAVGVKTYTGYYNDTAVYFTAFETNDYQFAAVNNVVYAPPMAQINGGVLPQMIFFPNAGYPQSVVLQTQPGQPDYNPLWQVVSASWVGSGAMPLITSFAAAQQWALQGQLLMQSNGTILNAPVIAVNRSLNLQDTGVLAPTISPNEFVGINPGIRTAYFQGHQGYYNGQLVTFLALETAPGEISHAPGAIPVPTLSVNNLGGGAFAHFYDVAGQPPVLDSVPLPIQQVAIPLGIPGYSTVTSTGQPADAPLYSPLWYVSRVTFNAGVTPQPLRSVADIQQAANAGLVTVTAGGPQDTFNCPIPFYYQSGGTGVTPVYTPPGATGATTGGTTGATTGVTTGITTGGTTGTTTGATTGIGY